MRVLVTGATGFVGSRLVPRLRGAGCEVTAHDRDLDVTDADAVDAALARIEPDAVVHLAALTSVSASRDEPARTYRVNYLGTRALLEAVTRRASGARVLLVGSSEQYGPAAPGASAFREDAPLRPASPYARTKAAADLLGGTYARRGLDVVRARAFNHTGPGQSDAFVASSFARQAAEIACGLRPPHLEIGNLESVRDFLDVDDVIEAYVRLLDRRVAAEIYNVASGVGRRIGELLETLLGLAGVEAELRIDPKRYRPTDCSVGDAGRLRAATGWSPRTPFASTLERLLDHWRRAVSAS